MSEFKNKQTPLVVRYDGESGGRSQWVLVEEIIFSASKYGKFGLTVSVPAGFKTDFASVPRIFWSIFPPHGLHCRGAVVHDFLYRYTGCSRFLADAIFREAMAMSGVSWWRKMVMYYAVRLFGWVARRKMAAKNGI